MNLDFLEGVVFTEEEISRRVRSLGKEITRDYQQRLDEGAEIIAVSILKGGFIFLADLLRCLNLDIRVDFLGISSYRESTRALGAVKIIKDLSESIYNKSILVVEDIIDTGLTLSYIIRNLQSREPAEIRVCTLLDRSAHRIAPLEIHYRGFQVGEGFLVGYGLDYGQKWRNLRSIYALKR